MTLINGLNEGMTVYHTNLHKTRVTRAKIIEISENDLLLELEKPVTGKTELNVDKNQIGRHIFFAEKDVAATLETIALRKEYRTYGNKDLIAAYQEFLGLVETNVSKTMLVDKLTSNFGFEGFLHYTDIGNFENIMKEGYLYSRVMVKHKEGLLVTDAALGSVLRNTRKEYKKYVRFFYRPIPPTIYANEGIKKDNGYPHMPVPVLLVFNESIIFGDEVAFLDGGGGSNFTKHTKCAAEAQEFDWDSIFYGSSIYTKNNRNAEFHVYEKVGIDRLKKIIFRSEPEMQLARYLCGDNDLYEVDPTKFCCYNNYLSCLEVWEHDGIYIVLGDFNRYPNEYTHELRIIYKNRDKEMCVPLVSYIPAWGKYFLHAINERPRTVEYVMNGHCCGLWGVEG